MKIGLVGPSYQDRSLPFDAQRTINLYPVQDETQQGKEISALQGTPGLLNFITLGAGPCRCGFAATNGRSFIVSGNTFYEIFANGTSTSWGTLTSGSSIVSMEENGQQLAICDGGSVWIFTYTTNAFVLATSNIPVAGTVSFIDGYFVVNKVGTAQFYLSNLYDGTTWDALQFASKESSPDNLSTTVNAFGQLVLLGQESMEIWTDTGNINFPFQRISGAVIKQGCVAPYSALSMDNTVIWVGRDKRGAGIVYRLDGFVPSRISTHAIEFILQQVPDLTTLRAYTYQQDGHTFYVLTGIGMNTTLVYDISTKLWHERAFLNASGQFETHRGVFCINAFGLQLVGDRANGNVYSMSLDYFDDNGNPIKAQRTFTHLCDEGKPIRSGTLEVDFEAGVGTQTGQGQNPVCTLEVSNDFAQTWSPEYPVTIGAAGVYLWRAVWRRLGFGYSFTFRVSITDPVKRSICGAYLN